MPSIGLNELAIICGLCGVLVILPRLIMLASNRREKK
jgi:hypothetical protein